MKKIWIITGLIITVGVMSCSKVRRHPGRVYMPDMAYSRAYETYASTEGLQKEGVHYTAMPVPGTIARGDWFPYTLKNDSSGYEQAASLKNPLDTAEFVSMKEAERLFLVNCAICHGPALDGNGPLYNGGDGPFKAAPKNLMGEDMKKLPDGKYFHSITYGKGAMGSYASQLNTTQRWMVIKYIRLKQGPPAETTTPTTSTTTTTAAKDTTGTNK
jgi:mono/diheme cytochrome c family protein